MRNPTGFFAVIVTILSLVCVVGFEQPASALDWKLFKDSEDGAVDLHRQESVARTDSRPEPDQRLEEGDHRNYPARHEARSNRTGPRCAPMTDNRSPTTGGHQPAYRVSL